MQKRVMKNSLQAWCDWNECGSSFNAYRAKCELETKVVLLHGLNGSGDVTQATDDPLMFRSSSSTSQYLICLFLFCKNHKQIHQVDIFTLSFCSSSDFSWSLNLRMGLACHQQDIWQSIYLSACAVCGNSFTSFHEIKKQTALAIKKCILIRL